MKIQKYVVLAIASFIALICNCAFAQANSAIGYWKTVDDKTGKVLSIVQFYAADDNTLSGKIVKIMPIEGQKPTDICLKCKGDLQGKPILGMTIIQGMTPVAHNTWIHGQALDPQSGNVYQAKMHLEGDGQYLKLRGFIGIPMFGRTETWIRTNKP